MNSFDHTAAIVTVAAVAVAVAVVIGCQITASLALLTAPVAAVWRRRVH